jgi:hypothetical protein
MEGSNMAQQALPPSHTRIPGIGEFAFNVSRNDLLLVLVAFTEIGLGVETALAHLISGSIKIEESTPVIFGPIAGIAILAALVLRWRTDKSRTSTLIVMAVAVLSMAVGVIGSALHWARVVPPTDVALGAFAWDWIIYAPPVAGPMAFTGVGLLAIIALLEDTRPESGKLTLPGFFTFQTPLSQTRQFFWLIAFGIYAATISSLLDHGRTDFEQFWTWIPVGVGLFGAIATTLMALYEKHKESDYLIFFWVMILQIVLGVLGLALHVNADLPEGGNGIVIERFIRGAPVMAPMLFAIMGVFGLIAMVDAEVEPSA